MPSASRLSRAGAKRAGCHGILVYTDNGIADPWLVAQWIIQCTHALSPLVAVQPVYMTPYAAAKMVATLGYLHGRRVDLNMVAGGFRKDLLSFCDDTAHDDRYERLVEYAQVVRGLLTSSKPFSFEGTYYRLVNARLRAQARRAAPARSSCLRILAGRYGCGRGARRDRGEISRNRPSRKHQIRERWSRPGSVWA